MIRLIAIGAAVLAGSVGVATASAARVDVAPLQTSSNWSGYSVSAPAGVAPITFSDVTGTWVQPTVTCALGSSSASAFWVGLGGLDSDSSSLQQLGTEADCNVAGVPSYYAWSEIVPAPAAPLKLKIGPGDTITAALVVNGQSVTMSIKDVTRKTRYSRTITTAQPLDVSSAEWVAEAPSACNSGNRCTVLPLANFGTVQFSRAAAIGNTHPGTILDPAWQATPIQLSSRSHFGFGRFHAPSQTTKYGATPGGVTADGRGFTVAAQISGNQ